MKNNQKTSAKLSLKKTVITRFASAATAQGAPFGQLSTGTLDTWSSVI